MEVAYYPGCTLKTYAKDFEKAAIEALKEIGIDLKELNKWYCCGTVYSLAKDNIMYKVASIRNLVKAQQQGFKKLVVLCSMCYNTLKQAQEFVSNKENLDRINLFMNDEENYNGSVAVLHALELVKEKMDDVKKRVRKPLNKRYAAYYGCTLLRPKKIAIDSYEKPNIMEELISSLGGAAIEWHLKNECCGSYNIVTDKDAIAQRVYYIIENARRNGAEAIVTSCPLCHFNLKEGQKNAKEIYHDFEELPVYYFTELMCIAFGSKIDIGKGDKGE